MARRSIVKTPPVWRQHAVLAVMTIIFLTLGLRVVQLQTQEIDMLQAQGDKRYLRDVRVLPERGTSGDISLGTVAAWDPSVNCTAVPEPSAACM